MFKKISAILISLSLLLSTVTIGFAANDTEVTSDVQVAANNEMAAGLLSDLGLIIKPDAGTVYDSQTVSRAEYVDMLINILLKTYVTETKYVNPFDDVYDGHPYFSSICYAYGLSIIDGGEKFYPDEPADLEFALNATASVMGYRFIKSYVPSWTSYIRRSDLTEGMNLKDDVFSLNDAYTLLYNALATDCIQLTSSGSSSNTYGVVKGESLGSEYFNLTFVSGRVTATDFASFTGVNAGTKTIAIDGVSYSCAMTNRFALMGKYVKAVANEGGEIIAMAEDTTEGETIVIDGSSFNEYTGNAITYYKGTALKKVNLDNAVIIYNGSNITGDDFSNDLFDVSEGTITVVKNKNGKADLISIESYKSFIVSAAIELSSYEYEIYASNLTATKVKVDLSSESTVKDIYGQDVAPSSISRGSLLTYKASLDGEYVEAIVSNNTITGAATSRKSDSNGLKSVTIAGTTYNVNKEVRSSNVNISDLQTSFVWYITPFGNIGAVDYSTVAVDLDAYLMGVYTDDSGEEGYIKIVDTKNNEKKLAVNYKLRYEVKLDGETVSATQVITKLTSDSAYTAITNISGRVAFPIIYRLNEAAEVTQIDTPYMGANEDPKTAMREIVLTPRYIYNEGWYYMHPGSSSEKARIEGKYFIPNSKNIYAVAPDFSDIYMLARVKDSSRYTYKPDNFKMYAKGNETYALNSAVYITTDGNSISTDYKDRQFYMVDDVQEVVTDSGDITMQFKLIYNNNPYEYQVSPSVYEEYPDTFTDIALGDLTKVALDDSNRITGMSALVPYTNRAANPGFSGALGSDGNVQNGQYYYNHEEYVALGKIYRIEYNADMGKYLVSFFTSSDYDEDKVETIEVSASQFVLYDKYEHSTVDPSAIRTYEDFGNDCDTLFTCLYYSVTSTVMFFRPE